MQVGLRLMRTILLPKIHRRPMMIGRNYGLSVIVAATRTTMPLISLRDCIKQTPIATLRYPRIQYQMHFTQWSVANCPTASFSSTGTS
jgi:hypothetical protein